jgi:hypothetical protein
MAAQAATVPGGASGSSIHLGQAARARTGGNNATVRQHVATTT